MESFIDPRKGVHDDETVKMSRVAQPEAQAERATERFTTKKDLWLFQLALYRLDEKTKFLDEVFHRALAVIRQREGNHMKVGREHGQLTVEELGCAVEAGDENEGRAMALLDKRRHGVAGRTG